MILEAFFGHETFPSEDIRVSLYYRHTVRDKEIPLRDIPGKVQIVGRIDQIFACAANRNHGIWYTGRYAVSPHSFVKVTIHKKLPGNFIKHMKQIVLYMREDAALRRIRVPFTGDMDATMEGGNVEGRFDIIPYEKFEEMKYDVLPGTEYQYMFHDEPEEEFFSMQVLDREISSLYLPKRTEIQTEKGTVRVVARGPRRRIIT